MSDDIEEAIKKISDLPRTDPDYEDKVREILEEIRMSFGSSKIRVFKERREKFFKKHGDEIHRHFHGEYHTRPWRKKEVQELIVHARLDIGYSDTCSNQDIYYMIARNFRRQAK